MLPATIDEVIAALEEILAESIRTRDRLGYFAALYHKVTCRVRDGIRAGEFGDDARMERLDVAFANRYIEAYRQHRSGDRPTGSWAVAFAAAKSRRTLVLQHLLLGMNAHINLDLGIAAAETAASAGLAATRKDFVAINGILGLLTGDVMSALRRVSPLLSLMGLHATRYNSILIQFSLSNARDGAWCFAEELDADPTGAAWTASVAARDQSIATLAKGITAARGLMRLTLWVIHLFEWRRPDRIIRILTEGTPRVVKSSAVALSAREGKTA